jgi:hypothetical protein
MRNSSQIKCLSRLNGYLKRWFSRVAELIAAESLSGDLTEPTGLIKGGQSGQSLKVGSVRLKTKKANIMSIRDFKKGNPDLYRKIEKSILAKQQRPDRQSVGFGSIDRKTGQFVKVTRF